jgi:hypothetical protein
MLNFSLQKFGLFKTSFEGQNIGIVCKKAPQESPDERLLGLEYQVVDDDPFLSSWF